MIEMSFASARVAFHRGEHQFRAVGGEVDAIDDAT